MKIFKKFTVYEPTEHLGISGALYIQDDEGNDWYECQKAFEDDSYKVVFDGDGIIVACEKDASSLFPVGLSVVEIAQLPEEFNLPYQWAFDGEKIVQRTYSRDEVIAQAENKKAALMAVANQAITPLQDASDLDIATDEELAQLKAWKTYRVLLSRVYVSKAPDVEWPEKPS